MGDVYWAPAGTDPSADVTAEPWVRMGVTDGAMLGFSFEPDESFDANADVFRSTLHYEFQIARTFDVPLEFLGMPVRGDYSMPPNSIDIEWKTPAIGDPPRKAPGLTGRRYRIARRAYARKRRPWVRAGSPMIQRRVRLVGEVDVQVNS